jgi:putative chitinase
LANNLGNPGVRINSGVRSVALNNAVGGSKTSAHMIGSAADITPLNGKMKEFKTFCVNWLKNKTFDQFISEDENSEGVPTWIHLGYKTSNNKQRKQFLKMINNKYYVL